MKSIHSALMLCAVATLAACSPAGDGGSGRSGGQSDQGGQNGAGGQFGLRGNPHGQGLLPRGHPSLDPGQLGGVGTKRAVLGGNHPAAISFDGEGLQLFDPRSGSAQPILFGVSADQLGLALEGLRGPAVRSDRSDCGYASLATWQWSDGLTLYGLDGQFVGWRLEARSKFAPVKQPVKDAAAPGKKSVPAIANARLSTADGIGIGSSIAEISKTYRTKAAQTELGLEFNANGLSGLIDTDGKAGRVKTLWSGITCVGV